MYLCGFSLDNLSLMALAISSGFVVDDAIVVMENITRHLEEGLTPIEAALLGAKEIGFTVFSISISLIAVFIPLLLMGGIIGRLFREFAITLSAAIVVSMMVSLTTTPMMCSRVLVAPSEDAARKAVPLERAGLQRDTGGIPAQPDLGARPSRAVLCIFLFTLGLNVFLDRQDPQRILPAAGYRRDDGRDAGAAGHARFTRCGRRCSRRSASLRRIPAVENVMGFTGGQGATNSGFAFVALKPLDERKVSAAEIIDRLRPKLARVPGAATYLQAVQDIRIGGRQANAQYQYTLQAETAEELAEVRPAASRETAPHAGLRGREYGPAEQWPAGAA